MPKFLLSLAGERYFENAEVFADVFLVVLTHPSMFLDSDPVPTLMEHVAGINFRMTLCQTNSEVNAYVDIFFHPPKRNKQANKDAWMDGWMDGWRV